VNAVMNIRVPCETIEWLHSCGLSTSIELVRLSLLHEGEGKEWDSLEDVLKGIFG
jgi:hypothetical protein